MSVVVAVACEGWGLVVSDTRVNVASSDGNVLRLDSGPTTIELPDGGKVDVPGRNRKLLPLRGGWMGAVASVYPLVLWSFDRIRDTTAEPALIARALEEVLIDAGDRFPGETIGREVARYVLLSGVRPTKLRVLWQDGTDAVKPPVEYAIMAPPELDNRLHHQLNAELVEKLRWAKVNREYGLSVAVRAAATVVAAVASNCDSVSTTAEVGVLTKDGCLGYAAGESQVIAAQDEQAMMEGLEWL